MVFSVRLTAFLLVFSLVLLIRNSFALTLQQVRKDLDRNVGLEVAGRNSANIAKEAYDHGVPVATAEDGNMRLEGRKMMSKGSNLVKKAVKAGKLDAEETKISGAAHSVGNCNDREKENLNIIRCNLIRNRSSLHHPVKVKKDGFTAFSADYSIPKSHPPKNN
ncbi:hypothetical protein SLEP1_g34642 [Rubroshorea leprosula]|uniref:Uncharacterized protein n=1 Tax=Rubroshorea leprosula TaxID=152421 RepID=A0AAV5KKN9_9ROSI|nr:hypothetical protein SLEP1_g34642 [Rubroshorea leprosula]